MVVLKSGGGPSSPQRRKLCAVLLAPAALGARPALADDVSASGGPVAVKVPTGPEIDRSGRFGGFRFEFTRTTRKSDVTEYQRMSVKELQSGELQFHRRNDNGVAGSGVVATVRYSKQESPSEVIMTFEQVSASTYQEGLFLKKPVPAFTLKDVLLGGSVYVKFELDSEFSVDAVRSNFKRLARLSSSPGGQEMWRLTTPSGEQYMQLQFFPYRNGTKLTASAVIAGRETSPGTVDFGQLIQEVQSTVRTIVKA